MKKKIERDKELVSLYLAGATGKELVEKFGISKQLIYLIVSRSTSKQERSLVVANKKVGLREKVIERHAKSIMEKYGITYDQYLAQKKLHYAGKRWSVFHEKCKHCATVKKKHHVNGYCQNCAWQHYKNFELNRQKRRKISREWSSRNKESRSEYVKKYYKENKERLLAYSHNFYATKLKNDPTFIDKNRRRAKEGYYKRKNNKTLYEE